MTIDPYTAQSGSGTRSTFDGFLGASSDTCIKQRDATTPGYSASHIIPENSNTPILASSPDDHLAAIFPFSFGVWINQVNGAGGTVLGAVDNVAINSTTIGNGTYPYGRYLYNVYLPGTSSQQAINYVGETGWICKLGSQHSVNPITGRNYHTDLYFTYTNNGFVPVPGGAIGGGVPGGDYCRLFNSAFPK